MTAYQVHQQYQKQQVHTASPEQLLIMLYDGAIRFCKVARKAIAEKDISKSHENLIKAQKIISEFMATLDTDVGGEAAENLLKLYEYLHHQLVQANIKKDEERVTDVINHLQDLRKTWNQAIVIAAKEREALMRDMAVQEAAQAGAAVVASPSSAARPRLGAQLSA